MTKRLAVRFGGYSQYFHRPGHGARTEVQVHQGAMWVFTANGKRRRGRTFVGAHASGHLKDPEAAEAFLPPANGSQVAAALASGQTRTARAIIIK